MIELCLSRAPINAPFPWFGGKRRVAGVVWQRFGPDINHYVEPFAGSLAVLLGRPGGAGKIETVNDSDRYLANFWRAVTAAPEETAGWADWPINEADMHARHKWLVDQLPRMREQMHVDPDFFDAKIAGWWVWGICQWIGSGWCAEPNNRKRPKLDGIEKGVHSKRGRQLPKLSDSGQGVHRPSLGNDRAVHGLSAPPALDWFRALQDRLRRVRVACGDWTRVLSPSVLGKVKEVGRRRPCAVFLDPPYSYEFRYPGLYSEDSTTISSKVCKWALEHGDDPYLRIALCGYKGEYKMPPSWEEYSWKATRGYAGENNENRTKERIWFSPHCIKERQMTLFAGGAK